MRKIVTQFLTLALPIFLIWFSLSKVNWVSVLKIKQATETTEKKLGDLFSDIFKKSEIEKPAATSPLNKILRRICEKNGIDPDGIKLHLVRKREVNAFALPDRHLVVYSALIEESKNEAELAGVLCHEIAHMEKNHVMKKLVSEVGLSLLISIAAGDKGGEVVGEAVRRLSSTAYDRSLETEADMASVDYMVAARVDPEPFANFLYRLSEADGSVPKVMNWIDTHPESKARAESIIRYVKTKKVVKENILTSGEWKALKLNVSDKE